VRCDNAQPPGILRGQPALLIGRAASRVAVSKRFAWIRSWWFVVLVILLIAVGLAVAS
jgi:hypothetical protein